MANTIDFRSNQIQTNKIIVSGSNKLLVYGVEAQTAPLNQGNIDPSKFPTGAIGSDVFLFISGATGARGTANPATAVFGGDVHISGNLSIDGTGGGGTSYFYSNMSGIMEATGSLILSGTAVALAGNSASLTYDSVSDPINPVLYLSASTLPDSDTTTVNGTGIQILAANGASKYALDRGTDGGGLRLATGNGGNTDTTHAGAAGSVVVQMGNGGHVNSDFAVVNAGNGGDYTVNAGNGGRINGGGGVSNVTGLGGGIGLYAGYGGDVWGWGNSSGSAGGDFAAYAGGGGSTMDGNGGAGGAVIISSVGGGRAWSTNGHPGYGGDLTFWAGTAGGTINTSGALGGSVYMLAGAGTYNSGLLFRYISPGGDVVIAAGTGSVCGDIYLGSQDSTRRVHVLHTTKTTASVGTDVCFAVSGTIGTRGVANSYGTTLICGDAYVSGTFYVSKSISGSIERTMAGLPYLIGGTNTTVNYLSASGQYAISSSAAGATTYGLRTTNTTPTLLANITLTNSQIYSIDMTVMGTSDNVTKERATWKRNFVAYCDSGLADVDMVSTIGTDSNNGTAITWNYLVTGTQLQVWATGSASRPINWSATTNTITLTGSVAP